MTTHFDVEAWKARNRRDQERRAKQRERDAKVDGKTSAGRAKEETGEAAAAKKNAATAAKQRIKFSLGDLPLGRSGEGVNDDEGHNDDEGRSDEQDTEHRCEHAPATTGDAAEEELRRVFKKSFFGDLQVRVR